MKRPQHNNTFRRAALILLALLMTCATAWAVDGVTYIDANGTVQTANNVTEINTSYMPTTLNGWYVVSGNVSYTEAVTLSDNTTIILADGAAMNRTIEGYGDNNDGWVFIASPVSGSIEPDAVGNIFSATEYDLYRFNQSAANGKEWQNYKATSEQNHPDFTTLVNGQGYLYATKETKALVFSGTLNNASSQKVPLAYSTDNPDETMRGWNLVGNPFAVNAYVDRSYYKMNPGGTGITAVSDYSSTPIAACTGIMVKSESENDTIVFSTTAPVMAPAKGGLSVTLSQVIEAANPSLTNVESDDLRGTKQSSGDGPSTGSGALTLDNAIVSFNEGAKLGKFYFGHQDANIYIPQGREEFAIAYSEGQGEMPLNFKAVKNGTYTLSFSTGGVAFSYLHLIDNMTGADVNLLQTPEYTFDAKTNDYASRFRLVFSTEDAGGTPADQFAYIDANGNIIITEGDACNASLQVVDVTGRVIRCRDAVPASMPTTGMTPGIYILRLINGDSIRTQKIVVK